MEDVHNGLLCCVGEKPSICVSFTCMNIPADPHIINAHTPANVFVSVNAIKYGRCSSPNYDSDVSLEF